MEKIEQMRLELLKLQQEEIEQEHRRHDQVSRTDMILEKQIRLGLPKQIQEKELNKGPRQNLVVLARKLALQGPRQNLHVQVQLDHLRRALRVEKVHQDRLVLKLQEVLRANLEVARKLVAQKAEVVRKQVDQVEAQKVVRNLPSQEVVRKKEEGRS